jgi:hypothetical protein
MLPLILAAALAAAPPAGPDEVLAVDRLRVAGITDPAKLGMLKADHSLGAVADHLTRLGLHYSRGLVSIRVADLPAGLVAQLKGLPPGEPFVLPADGGVTVNALLPAAAGRSAAPLWQPAIPGEPGGAQLAAARRFLDAAIPPAERTHFFDQIVDGTTANMAAGVLRNPQLAGLLQAHAGLRPVFARFLERQRSFALDDLHAHLSQMIEAQTIAYARLFSADELDRLAGFFGQPLGRKYLQQSMLIQGQPELSAWQQGMIARVQARVPTQVQQLMTEVQAALAQEKTTHDL